MKAKNCLCLTFLENYSIGQAGFGNNCAHRAKSVKLGRIVVQYLSFDFLDHIF